MRLASFNAKKLFVALLLAIAMLAWTARPASAFLDKTRFLGHLGIAYFVFHHWVLKPYEQGSFAQGSPHRVATIIKGGAALLFAMHEVHDSERIAQKSKDPLLQKLDAGLGGLMSTFSSVGQRMRAGQFNPQDINSLTTQTASEQAAAIKNGATIKDVPAAIPGS